MDQSQMNFKVWAKSRTHVDIVFVNESGQTIYRRPMEEENNGYYHVSFPLENFLPENHSTTYYQYYYYLLDQKLLRPDPTSRYQPMDVHGPSQIILPQTSQAYKWQDQHWRGRNLKGSIIYEIHVGTFSTEGTFRGIIQHLPDLIKLGINTIELMPIAQFPGNRNWGYDGCYPYAVHASYGTIDDLKHLVNICHQHQIAVIVDVVYNHLGPEGNYLADFGPYFTDRYQTPWGEALNFDGPYSHEVRQFFIQSALYLIDEFHLDGLRLDAVHAIFDQSAYPFLEELTDEINKYEIKANRKINITIESDLNDPKIINSKSAGGYQCEGVWNDDFHHSVHALLTQERVGYYQDFGDIHHLQRAISQHYTYQRNYSLHRQKPHGRPITQQLLEHPEKFIIFIQNHDQIGNRLRGDRLSSIVSFEELKLAAGLLFLTPGTPLIFMGEEYCEKAPFEYFISHLDPQLVDLVIEGRKKEFEQFNWQGEAHNPFSEKTFFQCKLNHHLKSQPPHQTMFKFYQQLIKIHQQLISEDLLITSKINVFIDEESKLLRINYQDQYILLWFYQAQKKVLTLPFSAGQWLTIINSSDEKWMAPLSTDTSPLPSASLSTPSVTPSLAFKNPVSLSTSNQEITLNPFSFILYTKVIQENA